MPTLIIGFIFGILFLINCGGGGGGTTSNDNGTSPINSAGAVTAISSISFTKYEATSTTGVASVVCPANTTVIAPSCDCDITTTGSIFGLSINDPGNGVVCGCMPTDLDGYDVVNVRVTCASSSSVDIPLAKTANQLKPTSILEKEAEYMEKRATVLQRLMNK